MFSRFFLFLIRSNIIDNIFIHFLKECEKCGSKFDSARDLQNHEFEHAINNFEDEKPNENDDDDDDNQVEEQAVEVKIKFEFWRRICLKFHKKIL